MTSNNKKYQIQVNRGTVVNIPNWEVNYGIWSTLAYERVIAEFLPGGFERWSVEGHLGCHVRYIDNQTGLRADCQLLRHGIPSYDFDEEDKPMRKPFTIFTGDGKEIECDNAVQVARAMAYEIFGKVRHHYGHIRNAG